MRKFKYRFFSILLALMMLCPMSALAYAENGRDISNDTGIIDGDRLNTWMNDYLEEHNITGNYQTVSVGFTYTGSGDSWYYNADVWMYSASLYKVPVTMLMAEKEAAGEINQDTRVNGTLLSYLERTAITNSNNDSGHIMVDYLGGTYLGKCSDQTIKFTSLPESYFTDDFYETSYYTARYITQVMTELYNHSEKYPNVIECLLPAQEGNYFKIALGGIYDVAQKYGAYEEPNGTQNNHCTAIIYTPTPIIVTVMTKNVGDYQNRISEIGEMLAAYSLELDELLAEQKAAEAAAAEAQAEAEANETVQEQQPETSPTEAADGNTSVNTDNSDSVQQPEKEDEVTPAKGWTILAVIFAAVGVFMALFITLVAVSAGKAEKKDNKLKNAKKDITGR